MARDWRWSLRAIFTRRHLFACSSAWTASLQMLSSGLHCFTATGTKWRQIKIYDHCLISSHPLTPPPSLCFISSQFSEPFLTFILNTFPASAQEQRTCLSLLTDLFFFFIQSKHVSQLKCRPCLGFCTLKSSSARHELHLLMAWFVPVCSFSACADRYQHFVWEFQPCVLSGRVFTLTQTQTGLWLHGAAGPNSKRLVSHGVKKGVTVSSYLY